MNIATLSDRSLRSRITKSRNIPGNLNKQEWEELQEEVKKRYQSEVKPKEADKWLHYVRLVEQLKQQAALIYDQRKEQRTDESMNNKDYSEDSMSELNDYQYSPSVSPNKERSQSSERREQSAHRISERPQHHVKDFQRERRAETVTRHERRSSSTNHRDRIQNQRKRRERSSSRHRHRERSYEREHRKDRRYDKEETTKKSRTHRHRRIYHSSEEEQEEIYNRKEKKRREETEVHSDYSFIEAIEAFEGDFSKWSLFRDVIEDLVLEPRRIPSAMKIAIVNKLVKGTAHSIWNNQVAGNKDIDAGWNALIRHYENPRQIDSYLHGLVARMPVVTHDADVKSLQDMYSQVMNFKALTERLGQDRGAQSRELCLIIANRFWNTEAKKIKKDFHTIQQLAERVEKLVRDAQILSLYHKEPKPNIPNRSFQPRVANVNFKKKCSFCSSEDHWSCDCNSPMSYDEKRRILSEKRLCGKCCRVGHFANQCRSRAPKCQQCGKDHATALHGVRISFVPPPNISIADPRTESHREEMEEGGICVVNEAKRNSFWTKTQFNGFSLDTLIDTGAAITLISEKCVPRYARNVIDPLIVQGFGKGMSVVLNETATIEVGTVSGMIKFQAYLSPNMKEFSLIIGRDQLDHFLKPENKVLRTVLGDYDFGSKQWLASSARSTDCHALQLWYEREDEEKVDATTVDMIVKKLENGRYEARLPYLSKKRPKENYERAVVKHGRLLARLRESNRIEEYGNQIMELIHSKHAVETQETSGHFIGHREVERPEAASTRFRVVLTPLELNELLWKGEAFGLDALSHLIRFRTTRYAFTADLQKAFLQIMIHPEDQVYLRFLWTSEQVLRKYQMTVLPFGVVSAPAILTKVIELIVEEMEFPTKNILKGSIYMDDLISGHEDAETMKRAIETSKEKFGISGFHLHKIRTNLPNDSEQEEKEGKVLGLRWNNKEDTLKISLPELTIPQTRRELLSLIGRIFDPYGAYDPCKIGLRLIHSKIVKTEWDTPLEEEVLMEVTQQIKQWKRGKEIILPRALSNPSVLWCFADASRKAYGYVLYVDELFVFGKAKIETSERSIVDGELQALFELSKAIPKILKNLNLSLEVKIMTDSQVNLDRLKKSPNEQPIVEARRLLSILKTAGKVGASFYHIRGNNNPADCFSRAQELRHATRWMVLNVDNIVKNITGKIPVKLVCHLQLQEADKEIIRWMNTLTISSQLSLIWRLKLWYRRAVKKEQAGRRTPLENVVFVHQQLYKTPPPDCQLEEGIWCYQTRNLDHRPMWIPKESKLAALLLLDAHRRSFHRGVDMSLALLPSQVQIQNGNRLMRKAISNCVKCRRLRGEPIKQPLGPLHPNQIQPCKAFEDITMDAFGPLKLNNGRKYWGLVAVCRTSQAVRLNILEDLTKETMLAVLMHQWGQSGFPKRVHSDHGTNFTGARNWIQNHPSVETMNIKWTLSTPNAPWMNGKSEKMVHVAKACLSDFSKHPKSHLEAVRQFGSVEKVINSRPVLSMDGVALSAFEIAYNRKLILDTIEGTRNNPANLVQTMKKREKEIGLLWKSQFLKKLSRYQPGKSTPVRIDDVFLIPDTMKRRLAWVTARVSKVILGHDGICRTVVLVFPGGEELKRPVQGLVPLTSARAGD